MAPEFNRKYHTVGMTPESNRKYHTVGMAPELELFRQCGIFLLDSGAIPTVWYFLLDSGAIPTVWYFLLNSGAIPTVWYLSIRFWSHSDSVVEKYHTV
jgi:hypothetical protein